MAAPKEMLDQVDDTTDSLMESIDGMQTKLYELYSTVGELIKSMADMLKSMAEMKEAALQSTTPAATPESQIFVDQDFPEIPEKLSIAVDDSIEEKESLYSCLKKIQIEMPVFEGLNVNLWLSRAERYFAVGNFTETEKLRLVYLSVDGEALNWFNFWNRREPFVDWNGFKTRLLDRFGEDLNSGSATRRLLGLKQLGSVIVYLAQFEELASQLSVDTPDFFFENVFVNGLKEEIQNMLSLFQPKGLNDKITMALRLENTSFCPLMKPPLDYD